ncbi:MAG: tRNA pseudouridine(55) synthase TruB [Bacteroidales bacterium]|nr:tRNA pseudouridine(55) synthase TruB [Bacteroidota bacterium]MBR6064128.1 tRNA pseudouridine(55) synthase TruB [Bacteroidales bacterium]
MLNHKVIHEAQFELPDIEINPEGDVLLVDKPYRCTSFDVVGKVRQYIKRKYQQKVKVGHAGTLDPLASGLLIICVGRFTKQIDNYQAQEKEYTGTLRLGATTPSFDLEKPIDAEFPYEHITEEMVDEVRQRFLGDIEQVPPQFSAIRMGGRRAYEMAREGEEAPIQPRQISIPTFEITRFELPELDFRIVCSKGTYIRSIARDFGFELDSGAYLTALRRTRIGEFRVENAIQLTITS